MSRSEDYLDNLLTSVTDKLNEFDDDFEQNRESLKESYQTQNDLPTKTQSALDEIREENFLREFEDEINKGNSDDDFLSEFERELNGGADTQYDAPRTDLDQDRTEKMEDAGSFEADPLDALSQMDTDLEDFFRQDASDDRMEPDEPAAVLDQEPQTADMDMPEPDKGEEVFQQMADTQDKAMEAPEGMEGLEDIFGDLGDADSLLKELENGITQSADEGSTTQASQPAEDDSLTQILNESDEEALSEIDKLLDAQDSESGGQVTDAQDDPLPMGPDFSFEESSLGEEPEEKKKKERNKNGLFGRLSRMLFGTPEELDPQAAAEYEAALAAMGPKEELDPKELKAKKKLEKELKKQQKKEEAEKKKQEKDAAKAEKAAQKASKPKKEKKPKQKNKAPKEPPLPKVPVTMMWVLALSLLVLVFLGTVLVGYSTPIKQSKEAF